MPSHFLVEPYARVMSAESADDAVNAYTRDLFHHHGSVRVVNLDKRRDPINRSPSTKKVFKIVSTVEPA